MADSVDCNKISSINRNDDLIDAVSVLVVVVQY